MSDLPIVGAAMPLDTFAELRDIMFEKDRDLELQDFHWPEVLEGDLSSLIEEAKTALDGYGGRVGIHGPFWDLPLATWDPQIREVIQKRMTKGLDVCEKIGGTHMVVHSPYLEWDHNNNLNYPGAREGIFERTHKTMDPIVKRAEEIGTTLVMENIGDIDPYFRVELAASFNSEAFKVSVDTGHAHYAYGSRNAPPVDYFIKAAGNDLHHIHLQDADGYADRHWPLGDGNILWPSVFNALHDLTSEPRLIIEVVGAQKILKSFQYLQDHGLAQ